MILKIYLLICILTLVSFLCCVFSAINKIPIDVKKRIKEKNKNSFSDKVLIAIKVLIIACVPFFNVLFLYFCTIKSEHFVSEVIKETIEKYETE